jgi:omega-6 fatty acid desaturase (delta-12 desaturase)
MGAADARAARQPTSPPPFTLGALRKAIPPRCFERPLARSAAYLAADLAALLALAAAVLYLDALPSLPRILRWGALWPAYWFLAGAVATGVWVIAHECGHGAFSAHPRVNDAVGLVLHSLLLVPYYSWKHSHRRHHSNTASLERDEARPARSCSGRAARAPRRRSPLLRPPRRSSSPPREPRPTTRSTPPSSGPCACS